MNTSPTFDVRYFRFTAGVDFVTIETPRKIELPALEGKVHWGVSNHYKTLTIHDPRPEDIAALGRCFPGTRVLEVEVYVDMIPHQSITDLLERKRLIEAAHTWVAHHLHPFEEPLMADRLALAYVPMMRKTMPYNYRVPDPYEQLLYGHRTDPVQVKGYCKRRDHGVMVDDKRRCMRIEVALREHGCERLGISVITDLIGFNYRPVLSGFLRMVSDARPISRRSKHSFRALVSKAQDKLGRDQMTDAWERYGVQGARAYLKPSQRLRCRRDTRVNSRIGKALNRLQEQFSREEFARKELLHRHGRVVATRLGEAAIHGRMNVRVKDRAALPDPGVRIDL